MVTLRTSPGDGGLTVGVDAYGVFGHNYRDNPDTETSDAFFDPSGEVEQLNTVFESIVFIDIANSSQSPIFNLVDIEEPEFSNVTESTAASSFNVVSNNTLAPSELNVVLNQEVNDIVSDNQRTGSNLIQTYTITNTGSETIDFGLTRYVDTNINANPSTPSNIAGRIFADDREVLFEIDGVDDDIPTPTFVGISATGGNEEEENYEIAAFPDSKLKIIAGDPLNNTVQGDGNDDDQIVDGEPYNATLSLGDDFSLAPGESVDYTITTTFNSGIPEELNDSTPSIPDEEEDTAGVDVYRFLRTDTQTQFYTTTDVERETVLETLPQYELEGISFVGVPAPTDTDPLTGTSPVYRYFNTSTGIHLYTADENERAFVEENLDNYVAEGTPYYGYDTQVEGTVPLYRFYNADLDAHFYTPFSEERDFYIESPDYEPEGGGDGIAFYVEPAL